MDHISIKLKKKHFKITNFMKDIYQKMIKFQKEKEFIIIIIKKYILEIGIKINQMDKEYYYIKMVMYIKEILKKD